MAVDDDRRPTDALSVLRGKEEKGVATGALLCI
jgi:hypothetical protein